MTTLFLIRHGATTLSVADRFAGAIDVPLSDAGWRRAERLGERLAREKIVAVYCSDMQRAFDTAAAVAKHHGLTPIKRPALREINHGHWEGLAHKDVERDFAAEYEAWDNDPLLSAPPGGETGLAVLARSLPELNCIVRDHPDQIIAVVSHKATNRLLLCSLLGIDPRLYRARLAQDTACLNILEFRTPTAAKVTLLNDITHCKLMMSDDG